jgi:hypothetical protein
MSSETPAFAISVGGQLTVRGRGRVAGQCLAIADIDQAGDQLQRILELAATDAAALDTEVKDAGCTATHVFLNQGVVLVLRQTSVIDPADLGMGFEEVGNLQCVFTDAVHAQGQGFDALQDEEGIERADRGTHVAQRHDTGTADVGSGAERFRVNTPW